MSVRIEGMPALRAALLRVTGEAERTTQREVKRAALNVQNGARERVPVDTGRLRNSVSHQIDANGLNATIGTNVEYAPYVEFGTQSQRPQPYLFPALESERGPFLRRLKRELGASFVRVSR